MRRILSATFAIASALIFMLSTPVKAQVDSLSLENFKTEGDKRYWEVNFKCVGDSQTRTIQRIVNGNKKWCSVDDQTLCDSSKFVITQQICGANDSVAENTAPSSEQSSQESSVFEISEPIQANSEDVDGSQDLAQQVWTEAESAKINTEALKTSLMREQVQIEEQRILIEQRRLELVQRELALKEQQSN